MSREMLTEYSFHDNDGNAVVGAVIDPSDNSGQNFMDNEIIGDNPGLVHYMKNATGGEKYKSSVFGSKNRLKQKSSVFNWFFRFLNFGSRSARSFGTPFLPLFNG